MGIESSHSVRNGFGPGTKWACSHPRINRTGQSMSASCTARKSVPNDVLGAARFAANATASRPLNLSALPGARGVVLRALAGQEVSAREPVGRVELSVGVLPPLLIHVHATLLDLPPSLALGFR